MTRNLILLLLLAAAPGQASHLSQADVDRLVAACEEQRESKLGPERANLVERCMRDEGLDQATCTEKNKEYGEHKTGAIRTLGKYYDTPECKAAYDAQKHFRLNPGR